MDDKKVAIMQPYIFPYLGYFQLINAVDSFVFYDDVNFIKKGWVNRNRVLINESDKLFTIPCLKASQNKLINEIKVDYNKEYKKLLKTIEQAYKKAPYFDVTFPIILRILNQEEELLSDKIIKSTILLCEYLDIRKTTFYKSSHDFSESIGVDKADRLIEITKSLNSQHYINPIGGQKLYSKEYFNDREVKLNFIKCDLPVYQQFSNDFIPGLSIIDVLMFNDVKSVKGMLKQYTLV